MARILLTPSFDAKCEDLYLFTVSQMDLTWISGADRPRQEDRVT